jgi:hypothetical protein
VKAEVPAVYLRDNICLSLQLPAIYEIVTKTPQVQKAMFKIRDIVIGICLTDPDPALFVSDLQDANKKLFFFFKFFAYYFLKVHLHHFSKIKRKVIKQ